MRTIANLIERGWPLVVGLLVIAIAYFQARGLSHLVGAELQPPADRLPVRARRIRRPSTEPVSGKPVLARNPFDAETGSLLGDGPKHDDRPVEAPPEEPEEQTPVVATTRPKCDFAQVNLIVDGPKGYGFAAIRERGGDRKMVELGDVVDDQRLFRIDAERLWFEEKGKSCQMELGEKIVRKRRPRRRVRRRRSRRRRGRSRVPAALRKKIEKVSDTEYRIERSALDAFMQDQASLMRGSRVRPFRRGGELIGLRMRVRKGTLFDLIGLKSGDVLKGINGFPLTNPQKALEAYGRLQTADELHLSIERGGKPVTIDFTVQ